MHVIGCQIPGLKQTLVNTGKVSLLTLRNSGKNAAAECALIIDVVHGLRAMHFVVTYELHSIELDAAKVKTPAPDRRVGSLSDAVDWILKTTMESV